MRGSRNQQRQEDVQTPFLQLRFKWLVWSLVGVLELPFETGMAMRTIPLIASIVSYKEQLCIKVSQDVNKLLINCQKDYAIQHGRSVRVIDSVSGQSGIGTELNVDYWCGPVLTLIGGGASVPLAILMTIVAAVTPSTQRVSVFPFIHGTALVVAILGFGLSSTTMKSLGNYVTQLVGLALMSLALSLSLLLPKGEPETDSASEYTNISGSRMQPNSSRHVVNRSFHNLLQIRCATPLLIAGIFATLGQKVQILILQYMPEQFNISFSEIFKHSSFRVLVLDLIIITPTIIIIALVIKLCKFISPGSLSFLLNNILSFNQTLSFLFQYRIQLEVSPRAISRTREFAHRTPSEPKPLSPITLSPN
ncbi:uncharacterized protein EAE98_009894 [Botrytis deweyae]|uniref:ABC transmembrane type-1 domain-containing protein n=1 Tax=Botrytis deweyae TaxID=2478750 RepID=A0ABQ7IAJ4_9HELO|nr:uncharacterized protein EAE98_009894 [Botrytis deweyae]KAF7918282.1 hypothetical protein EAE98_009894 [Botrytis deweyae]